MSKGFRGHIPTNSARDRTETSATTILRVNNSSIRSDLGRVDNTHSSGVAKSHRCHLLCPNVFDPIKKPPLPLGQTHYDSDREEDGNGDSNRSGCPSSRRSSEIRDPSPRNLFNRKSWNCSGGEGFGCLGSRLVGNGSAGLKVRFFYLGLSGKDRKSCRED